MHFVRLAHTTVGSMRFLSVEARHRHGFLSFFSFLFFSFLFFSFPFFLCFLSLPLFSFFLIHEMTSRDVHYY